MRPRLELRSTIALRAHLFNHFTITTLAGFGFDDESTLSRRGQAPFLMYLKETLKAALIHITRLRPLFGESFPLLDEVTRRSLELTRTLRDNSAAGVAVGDARSHRYANGGPLAARVDFDAIGGSRGHFGPGLTRLRNW